MPLCIRCQEIRPQLYFLAHFKGWQASVWAGGASEGITQATLQDRKCQPSAPFSLKQIDLHDSATT